MNEKLIEQLTQGDFSHVELDEWFEYLDKFKDYIFATIKGCEKNTDPKIISFILMYATKYYYKTLNQTKENDITIGSHCKDILTRLIIVSADKPQYKHIIKKLENFPNEIVRLHYCTYIEYRPFLEDESHRIQKVAHILNEFYNKKLFEFNHKKEQEQLDFLASAIQYGAIQFKELYRANREDEKAIVRFKSILFTWNNDLTNPNYMLFDKDILTTIPDKRILASIVLDWINDGTISFAEGMTPNCFNNQEENRHNKRTLVPNN